MIILAIKTSNCFLSYTLFDTANEIILAKGKCYRIGLSDSFMKHAKFGHDFIVSDKDLYSIDLAVQEVIKVLTCVDNGVIQDTGCIAAIGHHIILDVEKFDECTIINDNVISEINECIINSQFYDAPFFECIKAFQRITPNIPMFAIFDNAFLKTASNYKFYSNLAYDISKKHGLIKFTFQGISHSYAAQKTAEILNCSTKDMKMISCHLGFQSSICAIKHGRCIDMTSFAFQTKDVAQYYDMDIDEYCYNVKKTIGGYIAIMGGLDTLVFTSIIGENSDPVIKNILKEMDCIGISKIKVLVIPENAELAIAKETYKLANHNSA